MKNRRTSAAVLLAAALLTGAPLAGGQRFKGITEPYQHSTISATVAGRIAAIHYPEGRYVKKGEVILSLEHQEEELEVARRKLIAESKAELHQAKHQVEVLKKDWEATKQLFESTKSVSEEELWKKDLEYKQAQAEYHRLLMVEEKEELEYKMAQEQLRKRRIYAPFGGRVVKTHLRIGESCNALEPLVRLVRVNKCRFITYLEASSFRGISKKKKVKLLIGDGQQPVEKQGTVEFVSPVVDPSSGLREVKVVFDNSDESIQPGVNGALVWEEGP